MKKKTIAFVLALSFTLSLSFPALCEEKIEFKAPDKGYQVFEAECREFKKGQLTVQYKEESFSLGCKDVNVAVLRPGDKVKLYTINSNIKYMVKLSSDDPYVFSSEEKVQFLQALELLKGDETGDLALKENVTRAEFVSLLLRRAVPLYHNPGIKAETTAEQTESSENNAIFSDCKTHWAKNDIEAAYKAGIVSGISETEFAPERTVTLTEMATMAVRFVGLNDTALEKGGYPQGYIDTAISADILLVYTDVSKLGTRQDAAEMIFELCPQSMPNDPLFFHHASGAKPVIYLYPEQEQQIHVDLDLKGDFTFTYPQYQDGWDVIAKPNGTLFLDEKDYSYLFWEGSMPTFQTDFSKGFVVSRANTVPFLQETLSKMGLLPKEYNEFIVYWAPKLQQNEYNKIYFAGKEYDDVAKLTVTPQPDSILRVFMVYEPAQADTVIPPQEFEPFERKGFTVVEWGGCLME